MNADTVTAAWAVGLRSPLIAVGIGPALVRFRGRQWDGRLNMFPLGGWIEVPEQEVAQYRRIGRDLFPVVCGERRPV